MPGDGTLLAQSVVPCPLCGGTSVRPVCRVTRWRAPFDVARCTACSLLHVNPRAAEEQLNALYDGGYYEGTSDWHYHDERTLEAQVRVRAAGRLDRAAERLNRSGVTTRRVVELGSAFGVFLDEARRRGWAPQGCEIATEPAAHAEREFGLTIHRCDLSEAGLPDESVDLVTASEVVEHLTHPMPTFEAAYRVLRPGGEVLFSTANEKSLARLVRGPAWGYFMPGHVVLWSATTLRRALRHAGFSRVTITAGDERGLRNYREFCAVATAGAGSVAGWLSRRVRVGDWTLGAGMVVSAVKPPTGGVR